MVEEKYLFFFVGSDGIVRKNNENMPLDILKKKYITNDELIFRFIFDKQNNTLFIQDESFRDRISMGDNLCWNMLNQSLLELEKQTGLRLPNRKFGDPVDSGIIRKLSDYKSAWEKISLFFNNEFNVNPIDILVYEYVPTKGNNIKDIMMIYPQTEIENITINECGIAINRLINKKDMYKEKDVSFETLCNVLFCFYLENIKEIMSSINTKESLSILSKIQEDNKSYNNMFAIYENNKTRIFEINNKNEHLFSNLKIRKSLKNYDGPIILFCFDNSQNTVIIKNYLISCIINNNIGKKILNDIIDFMSKVFKVDKQNILVSFDTSFGLPHINKIRNIFPLWEIIAQKYTDPINIDIIETPFLHNGSKSVLINNSDDEDLKSPKLKAFRSIRGISISYPFIAVNNLISRGKIISEILKTYNDLRQEKEKEPSGEKLILFLNNKEKREKIKYQMSCLIMMGIKLKDILDIYSDQSSLIKRAEFRNILDEVVLSMNDKKMIYASLPIGINDWWRLSVQEGLNQEKNEKPKIPKPFNLKKTKENPSREPLSIEKMLERSHDQSQSQKPIEILLRESQI